MVGLDELNGLFNLNDSMILPLLRLRSLYFHATCLSVQTNILLLASLFCPSLCITLPQAEKLASQTLGRSDKFLLFLLLLRNKTNLKVTFSS